MATYQPRATPARVVLSAALFALLGVYSHVAAPTAYACLCPYEWPPPTEAFQHATVVFVGKAIHRDDPTAGAPLQHGDDPVIWTFAVDYAAKGTVRARQDVVTVRDVAACGLPFRLGAEYLVYAWQAGEELRTAACSGTRPLETPRALLLGATVLAVLVSGSAARRWTRWTQ